jgi:hypothetical protein
MEGARQKWWGAFFWGFLFQARIVLAVLGLVFLVRTGASWLSIVTIGLAVVLTLVSMRVPRPRQSHSDTGSTELRREDKG